MNLKALDSLNRGYERLTDVEKHIVLRILDAAIKSVKFEPELNHYCTDKDVYGEFSNVERGAIKRLKYNTLGTVSKVMFIIDEHIDYDCDDEIFILSPKPVFDFTVEEHEEILHVLKTAKYSVNSFTIGVDILNPGIDAKGYILGGAVKTIIAAEKNTKSVIVKARKTC